MNFIFDLDQTLIDSSKLAQYRDSRQWNKVYDLIPEVLVFDRIHDLLSILKERKFKVGLVTSSPSIYCSKVLSYHKMKFDAVVCYHDTKRRKPFPDPILLALERLEIPPEEYNITFSLGDHKNDIIASKAAGIKSIACTWGVTDSIELLSSNPDIIANNIDDIYQLLI